MLFATIHFQQCQRQGEEGIESLKQNVCWTGVNYINFKCQFSQLMASFYILSATVHNVFSCQIDVARIAPVQSSICMKLLSSAARIILSFNSITLVSEWVSDLCLLKTDSIN